MTEQEAVERITDALLAITRGVSREYTRVRAQAAWDEMKAIARENPAGPVPAWRNMTAEEAWRELARGMKAEGQNTVRNPRYP